MFLQKAEINEISKTLADIPPLSCCAVERGINIDNILGIRIQTA